MREDSSRQADIEITPEMVARALPLYRALLSDPCEGRYEGDDEENLSAVLALALGLRSYEDLAIALGIELA